LTEDAEPEVIKTDHWIRAQIFIDNKYRENIENVFGLPEKFQSDNLTRRSSKASSLGFKKVTYKSNKN
jgi:hypothetical protein